MNNNKNCWTVYCHTTPSGKRYIGITSQKPEERWKNGNGYKNTPFSKAIEKYKWENIKHEILDTNLTEYEAKCLEEYYIFSYHTYVGFSEPKGYNCTLGGDGQVGWKPSEETCKKISESRKGKPGKPHTEDEKRKISESHKGLRHTEESKHKMSEKKKGKHPTEETRKRMSASLKGRTSPMKGKQSPKKGIKTGIPPGNKGKKLVMIDGKRHYE